MAEFELAPEGTRCARCGAASRHLIFMHLGGDPLGFACEPCEEEVMELIASFHAVAQPQEAREGLQKWREMKAARRWPDS